MDAQIRPLNPVAMPSPGRKTVTLRSESKGMGPSLRKAILDCAHQATIAEPTDTDRRLHSFIAKLSGTMEGLGERELDAVLWNLMATTQPQALPPAKQASSGEPFHMDWWRNLSDTSRSFWLSEAATQTPYGAWLAFNRAVQSSTAGG